jgi:hypothetical protein
MSFDPYDADTLSLRRDEKFVSISHAVRFLESGDAPLSWEEADAIDDRVAFERSANGYKPGVKWKHALKMLRDGLLDVTGILEAGIYSSTDYETYPKANSKDIRWGEIVAAHTPDYVLGNTEIDVRYDRKRVARIDPQLFVANFTSASLDEIGCSILESVGDTYFYRWVTIDHLSVEREALLRLRMSQNNPFQQALSTHSLPEDSSADRFDAREKSTYQKLLIAALARSGEISGDIPRHVRRLSQSADELGISISEKTIRDKVRASFDANPAVMEIARK